MKDDLIKIINFKLKHIVDNIEELNIINDKIDKENANLKYIQNAIENFHGEEHGFDIYKFSRIDRETFNKLLMQLSDELLTKFGTDSCNYDGLIYLINGINNGISLTLTQEQIEAINLFIDQLLLKEKDYLENIAFLNEDKQKLEVQDLEILRDLENKYSVIIEDIEDKKYITEIDDVVSAIVYSDLSSEKTFEILCYLLKYNTEIYEKRQQEIKKEQEVQENEVIDLMKPFEVVDKDLKQEKYNKIEHDTEKTIGLTNNFFVEDKKAIDIEVENDNNSFQKEQDAKLDLSFEKTMELPAFDYLNKSIDDEFTSPIVLPVTNLLEESLENAVANNDLEEDFPSEKIEKEEEKDVQEYNPILPTFDEKEENATFDNSDLDEENKLENNEELILPEVDMTDKLTLPMEEFSTLEDDNDTTLSIVDTNKDDNIKTEVVNFEESKISDEDLQEFLSRCKINYDIIDEVTKKMLQKGNLEGYQQILDKLKELEVWDYLKEKQDILIQILLYSNVDVINEIDRLVEENLLLDEDDKKYTLNLMFETMPTVFIKGDNGNYNTFVNNLALLKEYGIDLINLFYFSREVYVADTDLIKNNYELVRSYDLTVNAHNAKYLLLLSQVNEKIDYFVEAIYKDNSKEGNGEIFEGFDLIKLYPNKLNVVEQETIKRLRYSSENERKVFGSKEKSLAGEITNLKVDIINMPLEYTNNFFNNEFDVIERDEVIEFKTMIQKSNFVELILDNQLEKLETYRDGLRYVIENINVSRNKVIRNYNILIQNGIEKNKALLFAICYNLVITKEEYAKVKNFVNGLGGN